MPQHVPMGSWHLYDADWYIIFLIVLIIMSSKASAQYPYWLPVCTPCCVTVKAGISYLQSTTTGPITAAGNDTWNPSHHLICSKNLASAICQWKLVSGHVCTWCTKDISPVTWSWVVWHGSFFFGNMVLFYFSFTLYSETLSIFHIKNSKYNFCSNSLKWLLQKA